MGQAGLPEDGLHQRLIHAQCGGGDSGAHVGQAGQFQQALQAAVLARLSVDQREDDVHAAQGGEYLRGGQQAARTAVGVFVRGSGHALGRAAVHRRKQGAGGRDAAPDAVATDADRQRGDPRGVGGGDHGAGGAHGDDVFRGLATEQHRHAQGCGSRHVLCSAPLSAPALCSPTSVTSRCSSMPKRS